jgi:hypothetical protein
MNITNWFTGVVEDIHDPIQMGRVRVRCFNYHSSDVEDIPTEDLPWATSIMPVTSPSIGGIGESATGLLPGSWVFGFFRDGKELQDPVILGSIPSFSTPRDSALGFADPHGIFPGSFGADIPGGATTYGYGNSEAYWPQVNEVNSFNSSAVARGGFTESFQGPQELIPLTGSISNLISIARNEIGVRETSKNQGPGIAKYWTATTYQGGYNARAPWCAAFTSWCIRQAGLFPEANRPKTAAAFRGGGYESWARSVAPRATLRMHSRQVQAGDLVIFSFSHIGIASTNSDGNGNFRCIEGNTTGAGLGGRDPSSGGVFEKNRRISLIRSTITIR